MSTEAPKKYTEADLKEAGWRQRPNKLWLNKQYQANGRVQLVGFDEAVSVQRGWDKRADSDLTEVAAKAIKYLAKRG